jgi:hypothetical protein
MMMMADGLVKSVAQSLVKLVVSMGPLLEYYRAVGAVVASQQNSRPECVETSEIVKLFFLVAQKWPLAVPPTESAVSLAALDNFGKLLLVLPGHVRSREYSARSLRKRFTNPLATLQS